MPGFPSISNDVMRWLALLVATLVISVGFFRMTSGLLVPLVLAAIVGAISRPMNQWIARHLGGRIALSSAISLLMLAALVFIPLMGLLTLAVSQAAALLDGLETLATRVEKTEWDRALPSWLPFEGTLQDVYDKALESIGTIAREAAGFFVTSVSVVTIGAATFFLHFFVFLYALFFFLQMDTPVILQILRFSGLRHKTQVLLNERIVSVSRATIKGTLMIALIQGSMGGISFALASIDGAAFWAVVMMVLAMLPGFGAPFGVVCGAIYLGVEGQYIAAIVMLAWATVISVIDNLLRPTLVGRDAQLHDLIILVSTLGGLGMFGATGLILGPVLAGLFVAIWQTLAETMGETNLPEQETPDA